MHRAALGAAGIAATYEAIDVAPARLASVLAALARDECAGNVTVPHKESVFAACAAVTGDAARCRAVNTFWHTAGELHGDNTDVGGFAAAAATLLGHATPHGIAVLGAGGAARAVAAAATRWDGATVVVWNRTSERAALLARDFAHVRVARTQRECMTGADIVVNATSVGLLDDSLPADPSLIPEETAVLDLVYRPPDGTAFVRAARQRGHRTADGTAMLVEQGALAFERWFGAPADREAMLQAVLR